VKKRLTEYVFCCASDAKSPLDFILGDLDARSEAAGLFIKEAKQQLSA
jgi:hypothetical protein